MPNPKPAKSGTLALRRVRPNARRVKKRLTYTVHEAARTLGIHKNTVRAWLKRGLNTIDQDRPYLILGSSLAEFLSERRRRSRITCKPDEFYCVRCHAPRRPALGMAEYRPITLMAGNLRGICPQCQTLIHRRVNLAKIDAVSSTLNIAFPQAVPRIAERCCPSVDCDSGQDGKADEKTQSG